MVKEVYRTVSVMERRTILMTPGHVYCTYSQQVLQTYLLPFLETLANSLFYRVDRSRTSSVA